MPKVMFYAIGSAALGSLVLTTANGSKAAESAQEGLPKWTVDVPPAEKEAIMRDNYGNSPESMQKLKAADPEKYAKLFPDGPIDIRNFTEEGFLVRTSFRTRDLYVHTHSICLHQIVFVGFDSPNHPADLFSRVSQHTYASWHLWHCHIS